MIYSDYADFLLINLYIGLDFLFITSSVIKQEFISVFDGASNIISTIASSIIERNARAPVLRFFAF